MRRVAGELAREGRAAVEVACGVHRCPPAASLSWERWQLERRGREEVVWMVLG